MRKILVGMICCLGVIGCGIAKGAAIPGEHPNAKFNERIFEVPVSVRPPVKMKVTLFMPPRGGPFPLVVMNHGASHDPVHTPE
jgi:hypothetical protein